MTCIIQHVLQVARFHSENRDDAHKIISFFLFKKFKLYFIKTNEIYFDVLFNEIMFLFKMLLEYILGPLHYSLINLCK